MSPPRSARAQSSSPRVTGRAPRRTARSATRSRPTAAALPAAMVLPPTAAASSRSQPHRRRRWRRRPFDCALCRDPDRRDVFPHEMFDPFGEIAVIHRLRRHAQPTRTARRSRSTRPLNGYRRAEQPSSGCFSSGDVLDGAQQVHSADRRDDHQRRSALCAIREYPTGTCPTYKSGRRRRPPKVTAAERR